MHTPGTETLELDAQGREEIVLGLALPILAAQTTSVRVMGFRPSMGVSGLSPREVARLRTLGLASGAKATGIFEGANDFRLGFRADPEFGLAPSSLDIEADLEGHPLAPVVSDLTIALFGLRPGTSVTHRLRGFTHVRSANAQGYGVGVLEALGREFGVDLRVKTDELGFEPQGLGRVSIGATRSPNPLTKAVSWRERGELRGVHVVIGGVRPRAEQMDRLEAELRESLWEGRRIEPKVERFITPGVDLGAFLQVDVLCDRGGAAFMDVAGRSAAPLRVARHAVKRVLGFLDSFATFDEITGVEGLASAVAARADFELALVPSDHLAEACALLREIGAYIEEEQAPGLVILHTAPRP